MQAGQVADEPHEREQALRKLPLSYSLALRLRDAGVAPEMICEYVGVEEAALPGLYRIADRGQGAQFRGGHSYQVHIFCRAPAPTHDGVALRDIWLPPP